jgi:DNA-binding response OmpR family regulator
MRIFLVQPDDALAGSMSEEMDELGFTSVRITNDDPDTIRELARDKPHAVLVCLDGDAEAALELAVALSARRRVRGVPLVFVGGEESALTAAQDRFPRANFSRRDVVYNVLSSLRH